MKPLFYSLLILTFCSCIGKSAEEERAIGYARTLFQADLLSEVGRLATEKENFKKAYLTAILDRTEFSVVEIKDASSNKVATVKATTVPKQVRIALIDIIDKLESWKDSRFNVPDAIALISKQVGLKPDARDDELIKVNLNKN